MNDDEILNSENKVEEYFKLKDSLRVLRKDLKDSKVQLPENNEAEKLTKKVREFREKVKENETVKELTEKTTQVRERMELLKEIIRVELLDKGQEEVKHKDRKLKLVSVVKELKAEDESTDKKKQGNSQYKSRQIFR